MSDNNTDDKELLFPSNSKTRKGDPQPQSPTPAKPEGKKVEKIITGNVRKQKRSFGKKIAETFIEDDTKTVGSYVVHDILIPAAKSLICDIIGWGGFAEMILFGDRRGRNSNGIRRDGGRTYVNYNSVSYRNDSREPGRRDISRNARVKHDFEEIILDTRGEAEDVLSRLVDLTLEYQQATVADLYDLVGITTTFADNNWGWTDLRSASVSRVRDGYLINLPRTQPLN